MTKQVTADEANQIGETIGIDWSSAKFDIEDYRYGMEVEFEHGSHDPQTNVTNDDPIVTGKIAWAHLKEYPDYYKRLRVMETEAEAFWANQEK